MPVRPFRHASAWGLALILCGNAAGQISYNRPHSISVAQRALPGSGPGAAYSNPAHLAEAGLAHMLYAHFGSNGGKAAQDYVQTAATMPPALSGGFPIGLSAGFGATWNDSRIDGSSAVYREAMYSPGFALSWPAAGERTRFLALGLALPIHLFNAFGAMKNYSSGADLGILGVATTGHGRLATGLTWRNLVKPEVELPDSRGTYGLPGWSELAFDWTSPEGMFQIHYEQFFEGEEAGTEGPAAGDGFIDTGINGWSIEWRPIPIFGVKLERPRLGTLTSLGFALHPAFSWGNFLVELNMSHDRLGAPPPEWLFGKGQDENRSLLYCLTLAAGL